MATYFHGSNSEMQSSSPSASASGADGGLQTLYLMNPNYHHVPYSDAPTQNMLLLNPNHQAHALNLANLSHAPPPPHHQLLIHRLPNSDDNTRASLFGHHDITTATAPPTFHGFSAPRVQYNLWGSVVDQPQPSPSSSSGGADMGFRRPAQQGLSLSLSSQQQQQQQQQQTGTYRSLSGEVEVAVAGGVGNSPSSASNGISGVQGVLLGSKYLKAAQELLDEVVNVGNKGISKEELAEKVKPNRESNSGVGEGSSGGGGENSDAGKHVAELTTAQRQELQMKKSKLVSMLDEVEQRYRQYHHQMQVVISSFEQAAGFGAAKSYTSLALKTISKQFRCLKDAISSQIRATSKTLGEDDCLGAKVEGSRLRYVDHHLRQQRALQQLGMIQPNAWRPQRGLPERAVSILRAWLFEHFLHPYPKDSDKVMLAKQTGLTRSQVSNWFINARVRLWKPMVEEMYMEEVKEQENNNNNNGSERSKESSKELGSASNATTNNGAPDNNNNNNNPVLDPIKVLHQSKQECFNNNSSPTGAGEISVNSSLSTSPMGGGVGSLQSHSGFHLAGSSDMQIRSPNKARNASEIMHNSPSSILSVDMEMKHINGDHHREPNSITGYGAFSMEDIGTRFSTVTDHHHHHHQLGSSRFQGNNGVSLTLGLPHNDNTVPISATQHGFLPQNMHSLGRRLEIGNNGNEFCVINNPSSSHPGPTYESIDIQNRKRFAAQLLHDFVA
ncbi:BEL1-like homeodomain protein 1 [Arachis stenosperma]|uniref:BEL1-like homeodomain protein 1 n=1 Tax=Arachis stenosperma TaxID=217475 RepID=UPI0025AC272B|nr:BEL1-like homeodomain protein 1 [Arachis stenosperma]